MNLLRGGDLDRFFVRLIHSAVYAMKIEIMLGDSEKTVETRKFVLVELKRNYFLYKDVVVVDSF
jgi:hypothetical protein